MAAASLALASCQKVEIKSGNNESSEDIVDLQERTVEGSVLVSATLTKSQNAAEAIDEALAEIKAGADKLLADNVEKIETPREINLGLWEALGMDIETYRITYRTVGGKAKKELDGTVSYQPIVLSGDIAFIRNTNGKFRRRLESVTLYHTQFNSNEEMTTIAEPGLIPFRTAYNALVVYPHFQGVFINSGVNTINLSETMLKARQALDCELAALEFIESLDDVEMAEGYYTEVMGVSNGSGSALATHYLLENELMELNREKINLKGTFCAEGCYSYSDLIEDFVSKDLDHTFQLPFKLKEGSTLSEIIEEVANYTNLANMKPAFYISLICSAYQTWKDVYFKDIALADYFSEEFYNKKYGDGPETILEKYLNGGLDVFDCGDEFGVESIVNPKILKDGDIDLESKEAKVLLRAYQENDRPIYQNWHPASPIVFAHSKGDEFCSYENMLRIYDATSFNGLNRNISIKTSYGMHHTVASFYYIILDIFLKVHPCPLTGEIPNVSPIIFK